jgi:(p)ppGpp synthase/HD superfamily hydrolase
VNTATISINFCLQPVEVEAADKVASMMQRPEESETALLSVCAERLSESQVQKIKQALAFAKSLESTNASHPSMRAYFSHPLRVARLSLQLLAQPAVEIVSLGLLHNVFEVTGLTEGQLLEAGFSERMASGIRLMTVDRKRQFDDSYLTSFYRRIQDFGDDLALIKCVDKLDNLLAFQLFDGAVRDQYLETTDRFVTPMAAQLSQPFGDYFAAVIAYMRAAGCDQQLKARYEAFKQTL